MTAARWLILADDLTGAADSAVAFAARGLPTVVGWNTRLPEPGHGPCVFAYDGESRGLPAVEAAAKRFALTETLFRPTDRLFVKIDSTLRGHPASEVRAVLQAVADRQGSVLGVVAPAFPATGRTTLDGRVQVFGAPLEQTELWRRDHSYASSELDRLFATEGLAATRLPLETIRAGDDALAHALSETVGLAICDAVEDDDLDRIVSAGMSLGRPPVWIGAGGLTAALARAMPTGPAQSLSFPRSARGVLAVVGSPAAASRAAAAELALLDGVIHVPLDPAALAAPRPEPLLSPALVQALDQGKDILINLIPAEPVDLSHGPTLAARLGRGLQPLADHVGGLIVTGGETAAGLLSAFGVDGVRLADEIEPGVSVGLSLGERHLPLITKAGAFGDPGVLTRALHRLRRIKQEGSLA